MAVDTPNEYHEANAAKWQLIDDLMEDVKAMQKRKTEYLPQNTEEGTKNYNSRVERTALFPGLKKGINGAVSKPFSKPVTLEGLPESMIEFSENMDGMGRNATQYGNRIFKSGLKYGCTHVLVDFPTFETSGPFTNADAKSLGLNPYCIQITPPNLLDWKAERRGSNMLLTEIRYREWVRVEKPDFEYDMIEQIRVVTPNSYQIYRRKDGQGIKGKGEWLPFGPEVNTGLGYIPFDTFYADQTGFLTGDLPYIDLAYLNLEHYRVQSDYRNNLFYAGMVMLAQTGVTDDERKKNNTSGPTRILSSRDKDAKFYYVEHEAKATGALRIAIRDIEDQMEVLGIKPFIRKSANATATGAMLNADDTQSDIQAWIRQAEGFFTRVYREAAKRKNTELPEDFKFNIYDDFSRGLMTEKDFDYLLRARQSGEISRETFLMEIRNRGLISELVDIDEEISAVEKEGGNLGGNPFENDDNDGE